MGSQLERVGAVSGVYGAGALDFDDATLLAAIATGDTLVLVAYGATLGTPTGGGWTQRWTAGSWKAWTKAATANEALPTLTASDSGTDPAGVLVAYRGATESYLVGDADQATTAAATEHPTPAVTVIDSNGLRLALWLGPAGGAAPDGIGAGGEAAVQLVSEQTSNASASGARWWIVAEVAIDGVPTTGTITLDTSAGDAQRIGVIVLRDRPPIRPAPLVDGGAGANIGLLP